MHSWRSVLNRLSAPKPESVTLSGSLPIGRLTSAETQLDAIGLDPFLAGRQDPYPRDERRVFYFEDTLASSARAPARMPAKPMLPSWQAYS